MTLLAVQRGAPRAWEGRGNGGRCEREGEEIAMNTSSRVISGEYLQGLHVQQMIISNKGLSG